MSFKAYRAFDLLVLVLLAAACDAATTYTFSAFTQVYAVSVAAVVGFLAIVRWNAYGLVVAPLAGAASLGVRLLLGKTVSPLMWVAYTAGYLGLAVSLLFFSKARKNEVLKNRWSVIGIFALCYLAVDVLRALIQIQAANFFVTVLLYILWDLLNLLFGALVLLIASKQPHLVVDMKSYLVDIHSKPESAVAAEDIRENKLSQLTDSNEEVNEPALLDGGMLTEEDLHAMDAPLKRQQHTESKFDKENKALEEYRHTKKGRK